MNSIVIAYGELEKIITGYASWVYSGSGISVLDTDKKMYFHITEGYAEIAVKSSSVLVKSKIEAKTEIDKKDWYFVLEYPKLKDIIETYHSLSCTTIEDVMFRQDESDSRVIKLTLKEIPRNGYPEEYNQLQKYKYQQPGSGNISRIFDDLGLPETFTDTNTKDLSDLAEMMVPKLVASREDNNKIQFEADRVFLKDLNSVYSYKNHCFKSLPNGLALGVEGASVLRSVVKAMKGYDTIPIGITKNHLVLIPENMILYITKGSLITPMQTVLNKQKVLFDVEIQGSYLIDILKRYNKVEDDVSLTFYRDSSVGYLKANGITQRIHLNRVSEQADNQKIMINPKLVQKMVMKTDSVVRLSFLERKGRSSSNFYMCYLDSGANSSWLSILYVRKG